MAAHTSLEPQFLRFIANDIKNYFVPIKIVGDHQMIENTVSACIHNSIIYS